MLCFIGFAAFLAAGWHILQGNTSMKTAAKIGLLTNASLLSGASAVFAAGGCMAGEVHSILLGIVAILCPSAVAAAALMLRQDRIADRAAEEMWHRMVQEQFNDDIIANDNRVWQRLTGSEDESTMISTR